MVGLDLNDIINRLTDLRMYSPELSRRMDDEEGLPEDVVPFLVERIEQAFARCETATAANKADALEELSRWLHRSYDCYLRRLARAENLWCFRFPKAEHPIHH